VSLSNFAEDVLNIPLGTTKRERLYLYTPYFSRIFYCQSLGKNVPEDLRDTYYPELLRESGTL